MHKPSILLVDDQIMMSHFLAYYLRMDYDIITRSDGIQALGWLEKGSIPDVIIADIDMSPIPVFQFIQAVKQNEWLRETPIVILTSKQRSSDRIDCLKLGAEDYLTMPFNPLDLELKIRRILYIAGE